MSDRISVNIPFSGFYESHYSYEVDSNAERDAEYFADERQKEDGIPKELWLSQQEYADILSDHTDFGAAYHAMAKEYCEGFNEVASEELGIALDLKFEEMTSPKYYNFETDRLFADMSIDTLKELFDMSAKDGHAKLAACIRSHFTSRDGFISGYDNDIRDWLAKPIDEWDHNETGTLLRAMLGEDFCDDRDLTIYYAVCGGEAVYTAYSEAVDWPNVDAAVQELRDEKLAELQADDPDYVAPPVRCQHTLELPFHNGEQR